MLRPIKSAVILTALAVMALGEEGDPKAKAPQLDPQLLAWVAKFEKQKAVEIERLRKKKASQAKIDEVLERRPSAPEAEFPFQVGDVGTQRSLVRVIVLEVIDDHNFIGLIRPGFNGRTGRKPGGSIIDRQEVHFSGFDTKDLADFDEWECPGMWYASGTQRDGRSRVKIEALDLGPYYAKLKDIGEVAVGGAAVEKRERPAETAEQKAARDEKAAAGKLKSAELLLKAGKTDAYRKTLKEIVEKYPETEAAKRAAELLRK